MPLGDVHQPGSWNIVLPRHGLPLPLRLSRAQAHLQDSYRSHLFWRGGRGLSLHTPLTSLSRELARVLPKAHDVGRCPNTFLVLRWQHLSHCCELRSRLCCTDSDFVLSSLGSAQLSLRLHGFLLGFPAKPGRPPPHPFEGPLKPPFMGGLKGNPSSHPSRGA